MPATEKRRCAASVARKMPPRWLFARQPHHLSVPSLKARAGAHTVRRTVCVAASLGGSPRGRAACRILSPCACCRAARLYPSAVQPAVSARRAAGVDAGDARASAECAARGTGSPFAAAVFSARGVPRQGGGHPIGAIAYSPRDSRILAAGSRRIDKGRSPFRNGAFAS